MLSSYRIQSIDLHSKSVDWFLYEGNTYNQWVNFLGLIKEIQKQQIRSWPESFQMCFADLKIKDNISRHEKSIRICAGCHQWWKEENN